MRKIKLNLQSKMVVLIVAVMLFQLCLLAAVSTRLIDNILQEQLEKRVLEVSQTIASMDEVADLLVRGDPNGKLQELAESIRAKTSAQFIVIGDRLGRRFSHPDPEKLGEPMVGGDNSAALNEGRSYVSQAVGSLGPSLRGKVPIVDRSNNIIGVVSVGYLVESIEGQFSEHKNVIVIANIALLLVGGLLASQLSQSFKRAIFDLEPHEIARMFKERSAILSSIHEAVVAINSEAKITMINQAAMKTLGLSRNVSYINKSIEEVLPNSEMTEVLESGESRLNEEKRVSSKDIIVNKIPIWDKDVVVGVVSSFKEKDQISSLAKELAQVQEYSDMLRHQTHEYSNKLYTISGLIQLEAYDKAIELIASETSGYQDLLNFLVSAVPDPTLAACVLGKYNRAKELNVELNVDRDSNFSDIPESISREKLVTILGNLLDNAFAAVSLKPELNRKVNLSLTDLGNDLIFEVEDAGDGVAEAMVERAFNKGISSSSETGKGMGLYLVKEALAYIGGHITLGRSALGGALFTVYIPKEENHV